MAIKDRTTHLLVMFPVSMVKEIEEFKYDNRIKSRSEAIRTLIQKGLKDS